MPDRPDVFDFDLRASEGRAPANPSRKGWRTLTAGKCKAWATYEIAPCPAAATPSASRSSNCAANLSPRPKPR